MAKPGTDLTLGRIFEDNAQRIGDDAAIVCGDQKRTYSELFRRACRLAAGLEGLGMRKQDRMVVLSMNNLEFIEAYVAGWTAGYVVGTVNFRLALPEIIWILKDMAPRILLVESQYAMMIPAIGEEVAGLETIIVIGGAADGAVSYEAVIANAAVDMPGTRATATDVASVIYTSGTTGRPKGCILGQGELAINTQVLVPAMGNIPGDRFLCVMPLFHIGAMSLVLGILGNGGTVYVHRQFEPAAVIASLDREAITHVLLAPTMVHMVLQEPCLADHSFASLRSIIYSAAPMPSNVLRRGMEVFGPIFLQMLGSSEGCSIGWLAMNMHRPSGTEAERRRLNSTGIPFRVTEIRIVDDDGRDCPIGTVGEVVLRSPIMFRGYWNNSAATLEAIRDGWYFSGDVGFVDDGGYLFLVDRKKDMIISGGENIYSREVEEALLQHPAVSEVAVIGRPDETWGETVCAIVVLREGAEASESELIEHSRTLIASYKKPRDVVFVEELPKIASGKIDKKILRDIYGVAG